MKPGSTTIIRAQDDKRDKSPPCDRAGHHSPGYAAPEPGIWGQWHPHPRQDARSPRERWQLTRKRMQGATSMRSELVRGVAIAAPSQSRLIRGAGPFRDDALFSRTDRGVSGSNAPPTAAPGARYRASHPPSMTSCVPVMKDASSESRKDTWPSCPARGFRPSYDRPAGTRCRTLTGFPRSAHASNDRIGRPLYSGTSGAHTSQVMSPARRLRLSAHGSCTPVLPSPTRGPLLRSINQGFTSFARPAFPSPVAPG
jgi:hypothetical protein